jgi:ADP-ribose pyrophosphatase YjhB (NUDIX family)
MEKRDIYFKTNQGIFSYRVGGILIRDGKVLLQRTTDDPGYAIPGGHVNFGEVSEKALIREFKEEIAADILPTRLLWIGENFFSIGEKDCHQLCLYYLVALCDESQFPANEIFYALDAIEREPCKLIFSWVRLNDLEKIELYPITIKEKLINLSDQIEHYVFIEDP